MRCAMLKPQVAEALQQPTALLPCPPTQLDPQRGSALGMSPLATLAMGVATTPVATGRVSHSNRRALQPSGDQAAQQARETSVAGTAAVCCLSRHRGGVATVGPCAVVDGGVAWAHGYTTTGSGLKVPLAPMPSRCKRARSVRASGGSTSGCDGSDSCGAIAGSGGSGAMGVV